MLASKLRSIVSFHVRCTGKLYYNPLASVAQPSRNLVITIKEGPVKLKLKDNMDYGIYALTNGFIREGAIEAARLAIGRAAKTKNLVHVPADTPITKKPEGTRMGKGKGKVSYHVAKVQAGEILFEFNCENETLAKEAFRQANFKLPVRIYLRKTPKEPRKVLSLAELEEMCQHMKKIVV